MAERGGFEPPIPFKGYTGLANQRLQPLGHLSVNDLRGTLNTLLRAYLSHVNAQKDRRIKL